MENTAVNTAVKWGIDPAHSEVLFKVKHLVITTVTGRFAEFNGSVESNNADFDGAQVQVDFDINSINTNSADRDAHLKSDDFFAAETYPKMSFNGVLKSNGGDYKLVGDLSIKDITKSVELDVDYNGTVKDPWGNEKAGFEINGKIDRREWGLTWNAATEAGGLLVGEEVKLQMSVQLVQQ